jgi:hypothetical protein
MKKILLFILQGTDTSGYSFSGSGSAPVFQNITINRRGGLRLLSPLTCSNLALTRGVILSSAANLLQMPNLAVVVGGGDSSYVDGPMKKTGNTAFAFPLGRNNIYAPLSITAPSLITDAFTAQYFNHLAHYDGYDSIQHDISLNHLSRKEYWMLERTAGTSSTKVTLSWKTLRSGTVNAPNDLRVAHWNGSMWKDEGNGGVTGTNAEGTIQSLNTISSFSPFTLASSGLTNPLPVVYIYFDARLNTNRSVLLNWKTGDEIDNDHFEVERSADGRTWMNLAKVGPATSHEYIYFDPNPQQGINYYRIGEIDIAGRCNYSQIRVLKITGEKELYIWPNPVSSELNIQLPFATGSIEIIDAAGRVISRHLISSNGIVIPVQQLKAGLYILKTTYNNEIYVEEFLKN